ncbi:MAG: prepilin-type N-terminal cleavage/methylation domain-containing protein [Desulfobacteraceae bacterium]|nr:prepilin-type N-terminal cleavage/methylation domain-containing protein [Desulfobacteraceae bacterium]MBC2755763.1 prepilin-type N-terminal cleavage/methylation domain-containing protein [Desulfobacteraceae bacterium]
MIFSAGKYNGFTLIEILIAVFIFSVVMSTIFGTFNAVISRTDAIKNGMGGYEMARTCLNRIALDLNAIYIDQKPLYHPPDFDDPPDPYRFVGKETFAGNKNFSQLRFASTDHLSMTRNAENGIAEIVYYVKEQGYPESEFVLKRSDTLYPYDEDYEFEEKDSDPLLCEDIEEFSIIYFDKEGNEYEKWDSESDFLKYATPRALKVKLKIKSIDSSYTFDTKIALPVYRQKFE